MRRLFKLSLFVLVLMLSFATFAVNTVAEESVSFDTSKGGVTFDSYSLYHTKEVVEEVPMTYEAWIKVPKGLNEDCGIVYGNFRSADLPSVRIRINTDGHPHLYLRGSGGSNNTVSVHFNNIHLNTGEWTHLTIVDDPTAKKVFCYVNGELQGNCGMTAEQAKYKRDVSGKEMCIGGDFSPGNSVAFKGEIYSVAVFDDVRTADEIKADMTSISLSESGLISCYKLEGKQGETYIEDLKGDYDFRNNRFNGDWMSAEGVEPPKDFAYSIALLGDTQIMAGYYPDDFHYIMDWLLENKEEHKISHVLNMGDMTNFNKDEEWELVREQYFRLNGNIDYTLVRGDHDVLDDDISNNGRDDQKYDRYFGVDEYLSRFKSGNADYYQKPDGSITNSYRAIEICGNKYLILTLDKNATTSVLRWAESAIKKYPDHRVIVTTHCYLEENGKPGTNAKVDGNVLFAYLKKYANVEFIISGHEYAYGVCWTKQQGNNGNVVNQILANPQGPYFDREGATGMIAMLYFSADGTDVEVRYISSVNNTFFVSNYNPVEGEYAIDTSCFKMSTDNMDAATPVVLEVKEPVASDDETDTTNGGEDASEENNKDNDVGFSVGIYIGIGVGVAVLAIGALLLVKSKKKK